MLRQFSLSAVTLASLVFSLPSQGKSAPPKWADSTARSILSNSRRGKLDLGSVLRGKSGVSVANAKMDEIADSMVSRALEPGSANNSAILNRSEDAILLLGNAGARSSSAGGVPYSGAQERLIRIAKSSPDPAVKRTAVFALAKVGPIEQTVEYLISVATTADQQVAPYAMSDLVTLVDPTATLYRTATPRERSVVLAALKKLWEDAVRQKRLFEAIPEPTARMALSRIADREKWLMPAR